MTNLNENSSEQMDNTVKEKGPSTLTVNLIAWPIIIALAGGIGLIAWQVKRWVNWEYGYEDQVKEIIEPIQDQINRLEKRVMDLENR